MRAEDFEAMSEQEYDEAFPVSAVAKQRRRDREAAGMAKEEKRGPGHEGTYAGVGIDENLEAPPKRGEHAQHTDGLCVECEQGKHANCNGQAWDYTLDDVTACYCFVNKHKF